MAASMAACGRSFFRCSVAWRANRSDCRRALRKTISLSTQTYNYFQQKGGYSEVTPDVLPPERRKKYDTSARKSKIMMKPAVQAVAADTSRA